MTAAIAPRSPEWHAQRREGIGSSDAPVIVGVASWSDWRDLFARKVGLLPEQPDNPQMKWGRLLEDVVAVAYSEMTGRPIRRASRRVRHPKHRWMYAHLDRRSGDRVVEIKVRRIFDEDWGEPGTDQIPEDVFWQVTHQLAVTGAPVGDVAVLSPGGDPRIYSVRRDEALITDLIDLEADYMAHVRRGEPPPPPVMADRPMRIDAVTADEELTALVQARKELVDAEARKKQLDDAIRARLADVTRVVGDGFDIRYAPTKSIRSTGWESVATGYRHALEQLAEAGAITPERLAEITSLEPLYTETKPGNRPLVIRYAKEQAHAAA